MGLKLVFLLVFRVMSLLRLPRRESWWKDAEILMLRHQLAVAERERPKARARLAWPNRAWLALLAGMAPTGRPTKLPLTEALPELQQQAAATGVAVVRIPEIPGTRACGATRWLNSTYPIVVLSGRYKTEDSVWFSFFHEAGHITRHAKKMTYIRPGEGAGDDELETEANQFAANTLIPPNAAAQLGRLRAVPEITAFANQIGVDPGIVAGRLSNDKALTWAQTRKLRRSFN